MTIKSILAKYEKEDPAYFKELAEAKPLFSPVSDFGKTLKQCETEGTRIRVAGKKRNAIIIVKAP